MVIETNRNMGDELFYIENGTIKSGTIYRIDATKMMAMTPVILYFISDQIRDNGRSVGGSACSDSHTFYDSKEECANEWLEAQGLSCGIKE